MKRVMSALGMLLFLCICMIVIPAHAETGMQDGLQATITVDKENYDKIELVTATLVVINTNTYPVRNLELRLLPPEGYVFVEGSQEATQIKRLGTGEEATLVGVLRNVDMTLPDVPETGDDAHIGMWLLLTCASAFTLRMLGKRRRKFFLSILLCAALLSNSLTFMPLTALADTISRRGFTVKASATFVGKERSVTGVINYDMDIPYTRAQWIAKLVDLFGFSPISLEHPELENYLTENYPKPEPSYSDIAGTEYETAIETAVFHQILKETGGLFWPNMVATRDFAAATAIRALGFMLDEKISASDAQDIASPQEAYLAVEFGLLSLINGYYYPNRELSKAEADQIIGAIQEIIQSSNKTGSGGKGFTFVEGTIVLDENTKHEIKDGKLVLKETEQLADIKENDIIVIGNQEAYKVVRTQRNDGNIEIEYVEPELNEFIESIDIYGSAYLDFSQFIPAENVTIETIETINSHSLVSRTLSMAAEPGDIPLNAKKKINGKIDLENDYKLNFGLNLDIARVIYNFDVDFHPIAGVFGGEKFIDVKNAYLKLDVKSKLALGLGKEKEFLEEEDKNKDKKKEEYQGIKILEKEFKLGSVPIVGLGFGNVNVEIYLTATAEGTLELALDCGGITGVQILNNRPRNVTNIDTSTSVNLSGNIRIGPKVLVDAEVFNKDLVSFGMNVGAKATGTGIWRNDDEILCLDGKIGIFGKLEAMKNTILEELLGNKEWDFLDKDILHGHWENLHWVEKCTYNQGVIYGTVLEASDQSTPIKGAKIDIYREVGMSFVDSAISDSNGKYVLTVPSGTYVLRVSKDEYEELEVTLTATKGQETKIKNLLKRKKPSTSETTTPAPEKTPKPEDTPVTCKHEYDHSLPLSAVDVRNVQGEPVVNRITQSLHYLQAASAEVRYECSLCGEFVDWHVENNVEYVDGHSFSGGDCDFCKKYIDGWNSQGQGSCAVCGLTVDANHASLGIQVSASNPKAGALSDFVITITNNTTSGLDAGEIECELIPYDAYGNRLDGDYGWGAINDFEKLSPSESNSVTLESWKIPANCTKVIVIANAKWGNRIYRGHMEISLNSL